MATAKKTSPAKKSTRKSSSKKSSTPSRSTSRKSSTKKSSAKKTTGKKSTQKSSASKKSSGRKYGPKAGKYVEKEMREMKEGKLKSGGGGKKVTNPKQAIAIGLSEARRSGAKVPPNPNK